MARKTQPYVCDMSVHASVFYISYLVFSSTFADNSPYLNRIGLCPNYLQKQAVGLQEELDGSQTSIR